MNLPPYKIPVKENAVPYAVKPYQIPQIYKNTTKKELERLLKLGVIERDINSPYAAGTFIIPKKDQTVRVVTDFRGLNKNLKRTHYPILNIPETIHKMTKPKFMTSIDVNMGYYTRVLDDLVVI